MSLNDINSLSHTKWNCKYHIVFAPKYRRKVFYREKRVEIGKILRQLCEWRGVINGTSDDLFSRGICLPSGADMSDELVEKVARIVESAL